MGYFLNRAISQLTAFISVIYHLFYDISDDGLYIIALERAGINLVSEAKRNVVIKLAVLLISFQAMMGICIYWLVRQVIHHKRNSNNEMHSG